MIKHTLIVATFASLFACAANNDAEHPEAPGVSIHSSRARDLSPAVDDATLTRLVSDDTTFALRSFGALDTGAATAAYAPIGVSSVMAVLYAASGGQTTSTIATQLEITLPEEQLHPARNALDLALTSRNRDGVTLTTLNQVWSFKDLTFSSAFLDILAESYGGDVRQLAGSAEANRTAINAWAGAATDGKITQLFPSGSLDSATFAATNAVYFNGRWNKPFEKSATRDEPFNLIDGSTVNVAMMHATVALALSSDPSVLAIDLPYRGDALAMLFVVPSSFADYTLDAAELTRIVSTLSNAEVALTLPKFTTSASYDLATTLGLLTATDFSRAIDGYAGTGFALFQSVYVRVDESGTEAAAATGGASTSSLPMQLAVDRPFYFILRDRPTGDILFMGAVRDPR